MELVLKHQQVHCKHLYLVYNSIFCARVLRTYKWSRYPAQYSNDNDKWMHQKYLLVSNSNNKPCTSTCSKKRRSLRKKYRKIIGYTQLPNYKDVPNLAINRLRFRKTLMLLAQQLKLLWFLALSCLRLEYKFQLKLSL